MAKKKASDAEVAAEAGGLDPTEPAVADAEGSQPSFSGGVQMVCRDDRPNVSVGGFGYAIRDHHLTVHPDHVASRKAAGFTVA